MSFSEFEDRDPSRRSPDSASEGATTSSPPNAGEAAGGYPSEGEERQGRRSPPPLPEEGSTFAGTEDWLDGENGRASHRASRPSGRSRDNEKGEQRRAGERSGQALVPRRSVSGSRGYNGSARSSTYAGSYRGESGYRSYGYTSGYVGGGGYGGGGRGGSSAGGTSSSGLTVVVVVALLAFFGGFAIRNIFAERGGFDDERPIRAANVPAAFRDFCFAYNGTASFTVVQLTSVSALTMASVPIYKMDTCTIPVSQTANALQALGIRGRADTLGPQLGGSNLTLIQLPLASSLARAVYNQFPSLATQGNEAQVLSQLETTINNALRSNIEGLALQSLEPTNIPDVYVMVPGHSFNLQPQLNLR